MVSGVGDSTPGSVQGFDRLEKEYRLLAESQASGLPYQEGASLTPSDLKVMAIAFDSKAHCDFWKAADRNTRCVLRDSSLKECSGDVQTLLNDTVTYRDSLAEGRPPTIADAYGSSFEYVAAVGYVFEEGLFQNEALLDASGNYLFQRLGICYIRSDIKMETRLGFSTPGYPHVTIISIQPQRARSKGELLCTEAWTLYYWVYKLARRARRTTNHCLPMRLVSLCGFEARVVSAVFHLGSPRHSVKKKGYGEHDTVKCQVHIEEYRDLRDPKKFWDLMEDMLAMPYGNADVHRKLQQSKTSN